MTTRVYHVRKNTQRIQAALQQLASLTREIASLTSHLYQLPYGDRPAVAERITGLRQQQAAAQEEYRRARCGAPPQKNPYGFEVLQQQRQQKKQSRRKAS